MDQRQIKPMDDKKGKQPIENTISDIFLHHISDMIFIMQVETGPKFRYYFINKIGLKYAGLQERDIGHLLQDVLPQEKSAHLNTHYKRALETKEPVIFIDEATSSVGSSIFESRLSVINDESGVPTYIVCVTRNVHGRSAETIKYLEYHDQLTNAWNRKALMEHLQMDITTASSDSREFATVNLDLDRFKQFNDSLGHQAGDQMLKLITSRLMRWINPWSRLYRLSGDEFVIIMTNVDRDKTEQSAKELLALFDEPFLIEDEDYYMSPSIGISMFPHDGRDADTLLRHAYNALLLVKEKGRAQYRFYRSNMADSYSNYILIEAHLRRAIEKNEFTLHYQPQVNLKTGEIESFEALLRWNNQKFGAVTPAQFIPIAEDTGLIVPIGEWVIEEACRQIAEWRDKGHSNIRVAINISPRQFIQPNLPDIIRRTLERYDLPASSLEIEITEGAMKDTGAALNMLNRLKEMGILLSVDDFGTGYSSLNYLKTFPIDILKIDQSFVREIMQNYKDAAITKTIIHLAHSLGLEVVAEGVEEEVQVDFLTDANCQKAQGYYFSKPVNAEVIEKMILSKRDYS